MTLQADVTCGKYVKAEMGGLTLSDGCLRFQGRNGTFFETAVSRIEKITWHWYSFSGAFEALIGGKSYFLSFVPRQAGMRSWSAGLTTGRQWRAALEGRPATTHRPVFVIIFNGFLTLFRILCSLFACLYFLISALDATKSTSDRVLWGALPCLLLFAYFVLSIIQAFQKDPTR